MYHVYKITLENGEVYIGCTNNIRRRKDQHNGNIKNKNGKFANYVASNYPNLVLKKEDLKTTAMFDRRTHALKHERELTIKHDKDGYVVLNDNYTSDCSRKGKSIIGSFKKYVVIDIATNTEEYVENLRQYCLKNNFSYKSMQDTLNKTHVYSQRYKVFYYDDWYEKENKEYYLTGQFLEDILLNNEKSVIEKRSKTYRVKIPTGEVITVTNLDEFARENNINSGNLHASFSNGKKAKGYKVIERI